MKLLLLLACPIAAFGQCQLSITTGSGTVCVAPQSSIGLVAVSGTPNPGDVLTASSASAATWRAPATPATPALPISIDAQGNVVIKANVIIQGNVSTSGSTSTAPTVITVTRADGKTCSLTFTANNSMLWSGC